MNAPAFTPGPWRSVQVELGGHTYTVHFADGVTPSAVRVHAVCRGGGYVSSFRRLPLNGKKARAVISKARGERA